MSQYVTDFLRSDGGIFTGTFMGSSRLGGGFAFSLILLDEAAQSTEPEAAVALLRVGDGTRIVLIGDHRQLAARVVSERHGHEMLGRSLLEHT